MRVCTPLSLSPITFSYSPTCPRYLQLHDGSCKDYEESTVQSQEQIVSNVRQFGFNDKEPFGLLDVLRKTLGVRVCDGQELFPEEMSEDQSQGGRIG